MGRGVGDARGAVREAEIDLVMRCCATGLDEDVYGVNGIINDLLRDLWPRLAISSEGLLGQRRTFLLGPLDFLLRRRSVGPIHFSISIPSPTPRNPP